MNAIKAPKPNKVILSRITRDDVEAISTTTLPSQPVKQARLI